MVGKITRTELQYNNIEINGAVISAKAAVVDGLVTYIENGQGNVSNMQFSFSAYTNYNGVGYEIKQDLRYSINAPSNLECKSYVDAFINFVQNDIV